jgi:long-chain acyl-CoA synthetase
MIAKSYINNNINLTIKETTFANEFIQLAKENINKPLLVFYNQNSNSNNNNNHNNNNNKEPIRLNFGETLALVNKIATGLFKTIGLKRGDVVGFYLPNCLPYILIEGAVEATGLILFQLNPTYQSDQLARLLNKGKPSLIVTTAPLLSNIRNFNKEIKVLLVDVPSHDIDHHNYSFHKIRNTEIDMGLLNYVRKQIQPNDLMYYGCTSGSTGDPKICTYTNKQFVANMLEVKYSFPTVPQLEKIILTFVPFFTTTGHILIGTMFIQGFKHIYTNKFNPEKLFEMIEKEKVNNISCAPSAILALINHPSRGKYDLSSLKEALIGGSVASNKFLEEIKSIFNLEYISSAYGMTEGCSVIYNIPSKSTGIPTGPAKHFEVRVVDRETREVVDVGFPGELEYRSEIMMKEYLDNQEANTQAFTEDRWFKSGDEAVMEADGFLKITGRIKEMIIRGGHNIWPNEIIDIMNQHPKIQETAVIGIPDKFQGESVVAFIIIKPGCQFNNLEKELREYSKDKLVPYSIPTYYFDLPVFPRNSAGKVYLPKLKEMVDDLIEKRFKKIEEMNTDKPITEQGKELAKLWSRWFDVPVNTISRSSNFFEMGGDSLVGVQTTALIKKYIENIPFNFLNTHQTLGQIEDFISNPEKSTKIDDQLIKDFQRVKSTPAKEIFGEINTTKNKKNRRSVAVTGATGYLGVYVVNELSKKSEINKIYCIGRSSNLSELKSKMQSMMRKVNIRMSDKIEFVIGDVTKTNCGINSNTLEKIKMECNVIIHCAAIVNWNMTHEQLKDANVKGVINAMKIAGQSMSFVYISSFGAALKKNETLSDKIPNESFGYIQTKWLSEHYVRRGKEIGIKSTIIRPCYIIADSKTGVCNTNDFFYKFMRQCVKYRMAPSGVLLNLTPVDKVAIGIVNYMYSHKIINLIPAKQTSTDDLFKIYNNIYRQSIQLLNKEEWLQQFLKKTQNDIEALSIVPSLVVLHENYEFTSDFLNGKNDFLNFEKKDINVNFIKLQNCGYFTNGTCKNLFERSIC